MKDLPRKQVFLLTLLFFYVFWFYHTHWILNMEVEASTKPWLIAGLIVLPLYLAIFNSIPFLFVKNQYKVLIIPSLWTLLEFIRGSTYLGFPWVNVAYSQLENPYFRMLNAVGGIYFTGFLIILSNTLLFEFWQTSRKKYLRYFLVLVFCSHAAGALLYYYPQKGNSEKVRVLIFQPNILPREEDDYSEWMEALRSHNRLLSEVNDSFDLVLLPESALPGYFKYSRKSISLIDSLSRKTKASVLLGSADVNLDGKRNVYNTALLVSGDSIIAQYNKIHLVPFGEWLPYENKVKLLQRIEFGQGDFSPGDSLNLIRIGEIPFGVLICFESIFPYISRSYSRKGAGFLANITSDGWYGKSLGPKEHFELLRFRAIESGKYVVRSAKTGISAVIDPKGRVVKSLGLFQWGYIHADIEIRNSKTLYTQFGDFIIIISIILALVSLLKSKRRK